MADRTITRTDAFENMMDAYDAGASLLRLLSEQGGRALDDRDITLIARVFRDMVAARDAFEKELRENAGATK